MRAIGRRNFVRGGATLLGMAPLASLAGVAGLEMELYSCSMTTETIAQALIASFGEILNLLQAAGDLPAGNLVTGVKAALSAFSDAFNTYEADKSQGNLEALGQAAEKALADVQTFLAATNLGGPLAQVVAAALQVIIGTLLSFVPTPTPTTLKLKGVQVVVSPRTALWKTNPKEAHKAFVQEINGVFVQYGHPELKIK